MATRSNIVVTYGDSKTIIYRHWDGYLSVTGYDIASTLMHYPNPKLFVRELLNKKEDISFTRSGSYQYELTSEIHGDIEWLYKINFPTFYTKNDIFIKFEIRERKYDTNPAVGWKTICRVKLDPKSLSHMNQRLDFIYQEHLKMLQKSA